MFPTAKGAQNRNRKKAPIIKEPIINLTLNPEKVNPNHEDFTAWLSGVAQESKKQHVRYYKLNRRAIDTLNLPNLHFYIRSVKIANFQHGGNISRQFKYFGGRWNRQAIYKNMAKLHRLGLVMQDQKHKRLYKPVPGRRRQYISAAALNHVRSRQDTLYLKFLLYIVNYVGDFDQVTHRDIKAAGFATRTAEFLYRYIKDNLNNKRLHRLFNAVVWAFRRVGYDTRRVIYWFRGAAPAFKIRVNVPKWRQSPAWFNIEKKKVSNGTVKNSRASTSSAEPAENMAGHPETTAARNHAGDCLHFGTFTRILNAGAAVTSGIIKKLKKPHGKGLSGETGTEQPPMSPAVTAHRKFLPAYIREHLEKKDRYATQRHKPASLDSGYPGNYHGGKKIFF